MMKLPSLIVTLVCLVACVANSQSGVLRCRPRDNNWLHNQWALYNRHDTYQKGHSSSHILPSKAREIQGELNRTSTSRLTVIRNVDEIDQQQPLNNRSLCPWEYVLNEDSSRYPVRLTEARGMSDFCQDGTAQCEPVYYTVRVLRIRTDHCDQYGFYDYQHGWERLVIGSTCARALHN